ncbi:hypothetical protein B296_00050743 [Ensete ventricosum]|uniref:Kinesin motor domain-containing protein n=1 Tax=Ensete ventricosum TaxID=4639 RepID=A0A426YJY1_ENSVE|nr:hypothetical protein B296_00050743 [Ensete ventricosum]
MASQPDSRQRRSAQVSSKPANSPTSSTTSSSRQVLEASVDGQSSPASSSVRDKPQYFCGDSEAFDMEGSKESVTVTVRFRPLSPREIRQGEEIAWYADGDTIVRSEHNPSLAYAYDRVFGPTTTTRHVYDVAAQHVVSSAMEGVNGKLHIIFLFILFFLAFILKNLRKKSGDLCRSWPCSLDKYICIYIGFMMTINPLW